MSSGRNESTSRNVESWQSFKTVDGNHATIYENQFNWVWESFRLFYVCLCVFFFINFLMVVSHTFHKYFPSMWRITIKRGEEIVCNIWTDYSVDWMCFIVIFKFGYFFFGSARLGNIKEYECVYFEKHKRAAYKI